MDEIKKNFIIDKNIKEFSSKKSKSLIISKSINDLNILFEKYLINIEKPKKNRNEIDKQNIYHYLFSLENFIKIIKKFNNEKYKECLKNICNIVDYEFYEKNTLLIKYGTFCEKFFLILKGKVELIIPIEKNINLYYKEYLKYITNLIIYEEYNLLSQLLFLNSETFPIEIPELPHNIGKIILRKKNNKNINKKIINIYLNDLKKLLNDKEKILFEIRINILKNQKEYLEYNNIIKNITYEQIKQRLNSIKINNYLSKNKGENENKIKIKYFEYYLINHLNIGEFFGELAPFNMNLLNYSILTKEDTYFFTINKENTSQILKECIEKNNKYLTQKIISNKIFKNFPSIKFNKNYLKYFTKKTIKKHEFLIKENSIIEYIYLLKKGDYEINCYKTLEQLTKYIFYLKKYIKNNDININILKQIENIKKQHIQLQNLSKESKSFNKYFNINKYLFKINIINFYDIIGLNDIFYNDENKISMFNYELKSNVGEYYLIKKDFYEKIYEDNEIVQNNQTKILIKKINLLLERIINIRINFIKNIFKLKFDNINFKEYSNFNNLIFYKDIYKNKSNNKSLKHSKSFSLTYIKFPKYFINLKKYNSSLNKNKLDNKNYSSFVKYKSSNFSLYKKKKSLNESLNNISNNSSNINNFLFNNNLLNKVKTEKDDNYTNKSNLNESISSELVNKKISLKKSKNKINLVKPKSFLDLKNPINNDIVINNILRKNCPMTSITARQSLNNSKEKKNKISMEIYSYKEIKKQCYIKQKENYEIKNTRELYTRFKSKFKFILKGS